MTTVPFGEFLQRVRKRAGMTQGDLAAVTGYSRSLIAALESDRRLPDVDMVARTFVPALALQDEPHLAQELVRLAALARGERPPADLTAPRPLSSPVRVVDSETSCWPAPPTGIVGREDEIEEVCGRVLERRGRLVTLVGPPGVGKTRLAIAVGASCQPFFGDGACFVPLAGVRDANLVASTMAATFRLHEGAGTPRTRLIEHLRRKEMLLVLDNFEQLLAAPSPAVSLVADLLSECPGLCLLVTSRERLHLRAEQRYLLQPLTLPAAVALFAERGAAVNAAFALTAANRPVIEAICEEVDRLPLALELCAGQIDLLAPPQLLAHLREKPLDLLIEGPQDAVPEHLTLREAISHSYKLLDEEERVLLQGLGVFLGGCDFDALESVVPGARLTTLHALIGKSLVRSQTTFEGGMRYLLLETIRDCALDQVRADGDEPVLRERHYRTYLALFRLADQGLRGQDSASWLTRIEPEQDNLRGALRWSLDAGRYADTAWLLIAAGWFWHHTGRWNEKTLWLAQLLPHRSTLSPCQRLAVLIELHSSARASEQFRNLKPYTDEMLALLEVCPNPLLHARAWHHVANQSDDLSEAAAAWERSIACARRAAEEPIDEIEFGSSGDRDFALGSALVWYASRLIEHGDFSRAAPLLAECTQIFEAGGTRYRMADSLGAAGRLALLQGDLPRSRALLQEAVSLASSYNYQEMMGRLQPFLGLATLYLGDAVEARRLLSESLRLCLDLNDQFFLARVYTYLAELELWVGDLDLAQNLLAKGLAHHATARWSRVFPVERLLLAARLAAARGDYERGAVLFGAAERAREDTSYEPVGVVRRLAEHAQATVCAKLQPTALESARSRGEHMTLAEAFATSVNLAR